MKKIIISESQLRDIVKTILNEESPDTDKNGIISPEELYSHFDLDGDGVVTMSDYASHVDYHAKHPDLLDPYRDTEEYLSKIEENRDIFKEFFNKK